jgi:hypothetical protein
VDRVGYARLIDRYSLPARPLRAVSAISTAVHGRRVRDLGTEVIHQFQTTYRPDDTLFGDLQFALRYEGLNLEVLFHLFTAIGGEPIRALYTHQPQSAAARRLAYVFEWLTGQQLDAPATSPKATYVRVLDDSLQFGMAAPASKRDTKYRVTDNLPGNRNFCPLVTKTPYLTEMVGKELKQRTADALAQYDPALLRRAAEFLYLKETHSSFEVEREKPSPDKARRFADLLHDAELGTPLSESRFVELQNAVVDPRFREASYRTEQNWIGDDLGYRKRVEFVPPRPEDVRPLMDGLVDLSERLRLAPDAMDPIISAAALSFGFVFIHPFMDGNGRLHRYLIHESLSTAGFTPKGIILPVSAVIVANLDRYKSALEAFSRPMRDRTSFNPDIVSVPATGNDAVYFRYVDATEQASFLFNALERTVEEDLPAEISFLMGFDRARRELNALADWPSHSLENFILVVHQNGGRLSRTKRHSHFAWMQDEEVARFERMVADSFIEHRED